MAACNDIVAQCSNAVPGNDAPECIVRNLFAAEALSAQLETARLWRYRRTISTDAARIIQRATRVFLARRKVERVRLDRQRMEAALKVQAEWRRGAEAELQRKVEALHNAARVIQRLFRSLLSMKRRREQVEELRVRKRDVIALEERRDSAAVTIQRIWRGHCGRERSRRIRAHLDGAKRWKHYNDAARIIQRSWRSWRAKIVARVERCKLRGIPMPNVPKPRSLLRRNQPGADTAPCVRV